MTYFRAILLTAGLVVEAVPLIRADESRREVLTPSRRILSNTETIYRANHYRAWHDAMKSAGYEVDVRSFDDPKVRQQLAGLTAGQLLERYDLVALATISPDTTFGMFPALEEFVRQGGGLLLVQTTSSERWHRQPINLMLPITAFPHGPGWNTAFNSTSFRLSRSGEHPITAGIDWSGCLEVPVVFPTWTPDSEMMRGTLQLVAPREVLIKQTLNTGWRTILTAQDAEHSPAAVVGRYGRGRIFIFGCWLGMTEGKDHMVDFTRWEGFRPLWQNAVRWLTGPGKVRPDQPVAWVIGSEADDLRSLPRAVSYPLEELGFRRGGPAEARAALVAKADTRQDAALRKLAEAGRPVMVLDPEQLRGDLAPLSPLKAGTKEPDDTPFPNDHVSIRWTGQVTPEFSEEYTFYTFNDDGARLWVDGKLLINDWTGHPTAENKGTITLTAGRKVDIRLDYFQTEGGGEVSLWWSSKSVKKQVVPTDRLTPPSPRTGHGLLGDYYLGHDFNRLFMRRRDDAPWFLTGNDRSRFRLQSIVLGAPAPPPAKLPRPESFSFAPLGPLTDPAVQPPGRWKFQSLQCDSSTLDLREKWYAGDHDDSAWEERGPGDLVQEIGGAPCAYTGAVWYRAAIDVPANLPAEAGWSIESRNNRPYPTHLRAWIDGKEVALEPFDDGGDRRRKGAFLRLSRAPSGRHVLALRFYLAAQEGIAPYDNHGLSGIVAEKRPTPPAPPPKSGKADLTQWAAVAEQVVRYPERSLLFHGKTDGDRDFHLLVNLEEEQARRAPLLVFNEPGLIRKVRVNGRQLQRIPQGSWDGNTCRPTSAFLLQGVLKEGENVIEFHPDFTRYYGQDFPVTPETAAWCDLPRIEFTGPLQVLLPEDPLLACYVPARLFMPGPTAPAAEGARVLLRWNDGRPALVRKGSVLAWTSNLNPVVRPGSHFGGQFNACCKQMWEESWEGSWYTEYQQPEFPREPTPWFSRPDSLLYENAAPLLWACLASAVELDRPRLLDIHRRPGERALELTIDNPGPARPVLLSYRLFDWQGSFLANEVRSVELAARGPTHVEIAVPAGAEEGAGLSDEVLLRAGLRSEDNATGLDYREKLIEFTPDFRIALASDSIHERLAGGRLPERLRGVAGFRSRHLWYPLLTQDPGAVVYLSGETTHVTVTLTNETGEEIRLPVQMELRAQARGKVEKEQRATVTLPPRGRRVLRLEHVVSGVLEPYQVRVRAGANRDLVTKTLSFCAVEPWKRSHEVAERVPGAPSSFGGNQPLTTWMQPDNIQARRPFDRGDGEWFRLEEWYVQTRSGAIGHGGGINGFTGETEGFGWGPYFQTHYYCPDQGGVLPNGQPFMHYIADGMRSHTLGRPAEYECADFWGNYWVQPRWNSVTNFREWLAVRTPERAQAFAPRTLAEAEKLTAGPFAAEYDRWVTAVVSGGWGAIRSAAAPGSRFWSQAEACNIAAERGCTSAPLVRFLLRRDVAGDIDPGTSRMGLGWRYRSFYETTTAALLPDDAHFNVTACRHMCALNEQRMRNMGNATPETYRAHVLDTLWTAAVRPDGSLRAVVDTAFSDISAGMVSGLRAGNRIYNEAYHLAAVAEPQKALGLLWVAVGERETAVNARQVYELLLNSGVPLGAMIGPEHLAVAPATGASGLVYLVPPALNDAVRSRLEDLAAKKFPVICLVAPGAERAALPEGVTVIELQVKYHPEVRSYQSLYTPETARALAGRISETTGRPLEAGPGACVHGCQAQGRTFLVVQNLWPEQRTVSVHVARKAARLPGRVTAVSLNDHSVMETKVEGDRLTLAARVGPWDAVLILLAPGPE